MDGSEEVTIRFTFDDFWRPRWTVIIGEGPSAAEGSGDSLTDASWAAQSAKRLALRPPLVVDAPGDT